MPATPRPTPGPTSGIAAIWLCALTVVMLTLAFPPFYVWPMAFFAAVPMTVCIIRRPLKFRWLALYYATGCAFFVPNLFWLWPVTAWGTQALAAYISLYFVLYAVGVRRLVADLRVPATLAVPLVWTAVEFARCTFLEGGFPWFIVGNAFASNRSILGGLSTCFLQIADLFGVWGVTFFALTVSGFIVDLLRLPLLLPRKGGKPRLNPAIRTLVIYTATVIAGTLAYGLFRMAEYPRVIQPGPRVAVIQENIPQKLKDDPKRFEVNFQKHIQLTRDAVAAHQPAVIAWPETMAPYSFNPEWLAFARMPEVLNETSRGILEKSVASYAQLRALSDTTGAYLLVGNNTIILTPESADQANSAALIAPRRGEIARYNKVHLVPFGEYIPFAGKGTWLRQVLQKLTPLDYDYSLLPGAEWTRFSLPAGSNQPDFHFATPICFEDVMPGPARAMAAPLPDGKKRVDFLLNISNDGWFYSAELNQHLQASQLRAVENRVPIARSVNTGNSGFIDSCGRITQLLPVHAVGTLGQQLDLDPRVTLYARVGDVLPILSGIAAVLCVAWTFVRPRRGGKAVD